MNPMFDFNGDGRMDMLEFLIVTANDPDNPINRDEDADCDDEQEYEDDEF